MRAVKLRTLTLAIVTAVALSACGGGVDPDEDTTETRFEVAPTGDALTIDPLGSIPGATPFVTDGVSVDVPAGFDAAREELGKGMVQLVIKDPAQERAAAVITVTPGTGVSDGAVDVSSLATQGQLGAAGFTDTSRTPATWEGWAYATAIEGTLEFPDDPATGNRDFLYLTLRDDAGTMIVGISTDAATGSLEDSIGMEILRTLRPVQ